MKNLFTDLVKTPFANAVGGAKEALKRVTAVFDISAWVLIAIGAAWLFFSDVSLLGMMIRIGLFCSVIAGFVIVVSRIMFPQINLDDFVKDAREGKSGSATVVAAILISNAVMFLAMVIWSLV